MDVMLKNDLREYLKHQVYQLVFLMMRLPINPDKYTGGKKAFTNQVYISCSKNSLVRLHG